MNKKLKNMTSWAMLTVILFASCSFQLHFMHCNEMKSTEVSFFKCYEKFKHCSENNESYCEESPCCPAEDNFAFSNINNKSNINIKTFEDACCFEYHKFYNSDINSDVIQRIQSSVSTNFVIIVAQIFDFNLYKKEIQNSNKVTDISPPETLIKQILKSILKKNIESPDAFFA